MEKLRAGAGLRAPTITRHLLFVGNPGTGKTTVARLVGGICRALGLLSTGVLVEVDRSELVAGYLGQTATETAEVVAPAAGGVLFVDEAYSLAGDRYGREGRRHPGRGDGGPARRPRPRRGRLPGTDGRLHRPEPAARRPAARPRPRGAARLQLPARAGLVYCDFKPDNLIQVGDAVELIDLGGVRRLDDDESASYGTVGHQAP